MNESRGDHTDEQERMRKGKYKISWKSVGDIAEYEVQISDINRKIVLEERVASNYLKFNLPAGSYHVRIGTVNKFKKIGSWSDWENVEIKIKKSGSRNTERHERPEKHKSPERHKNPKATLNFLNLGLKISAGGCYYQIISKWNSIYYNSYSGAMARIGYCPGNSSALKRPNFLKSIGFEFESSYIEFQGRDNLFRSNTRFTNMNIGGNIYYTTKFRFPLNIIIRGGGGIVLTEQKYQNYIFSGTIFSRDPFLKGGLSLELRIYRLIFLECGADYSVIKYQSQDFGSLRYFCTVGFLL